jgi:uncharacterized protein YfbU (UPF0304 family)
MLCYVPMVTLFGVGSEALAPEWPKFAKEMTARWIAEMRQYHDAKMEIAQIIIGRPIGRL